MEDSNTLWGAITTLGGGIMFLFKRSLNKFDEEQKDQREEIDGLRDLIYDKYAKIEDLNTFKTENLHALDRIHNRVDDMSNDIKTLLRGNK